MPSLSFECCGHRVVDAQGAIAMLMVPLIQGGLILLVSVFGLVWQLRSKITGASSLRSGKRGLDKLPVTLFNTVLPAILAGYALISIPRYSDTTAVDAATAMDAFIIQYCDDNQRLSASARLHARVPELTAGPGWFYFSGDSTYLMVRYPVKWRNRNAPGLPQTSEFTATDYSCLLEQHCENPDDSA